MAWKDSINSALLKTTGHALTKPTEDLERRIRAEAKEACDARVRRLKARHQADVKARLAQQRKQFAARRAERIRAAEQRRAQRAEEAARARAAGEHLPFYLDQESRSTIVAVQDRTMTNPPKLHALIEAVRYVHARGIEGAVVECGVWRGGSMMTIATTLVNLGSTERDLHLFDTFEGMSAPTDNDVRVRDGRSAAELLADENEATVLADATLADVQEGMQSVSYPAERIHYHVGMVEDTVPAQAPDRIALLRLDTDWYASTKHELNHLWERLTPGGILILDDFGYWEGARKATLEWMEETDNRLFLAPMASGRIAVKPL
jgi:O-methyltransferase